MRSFTGTLICTQTTEGTHFGGLEMRSKQLVSSALLSQTSKASEELRREQEYKYLK